MKNYKIIFRYDGAKFCGFQKQVNDRTVQEEIEKALAKIHKNELEFNITASGRTDSKVHAYAQVANFMSPLGLEDESMKKALNTHLPEDIYVFDCEVVADDFHSRFSAIRKDYVYKLNIKEYNPFYRDYVYQYNRKLNVHAMQTAIKFFIGKHNFQSFCANNPDEKNMEREIFDATIENNDGLITFYFSGSSFLRYMVRIIVGTLIEIGEEKYKPEKVIEIIEARERSQSGRTAPGCGLYLKDVFYQ
jgi:tRNA pseudouridine38-40 synthase